MVDDYSQDSEEEEMHDLRDEIERGGTGRAKAVAKDKVLADRKSRGGQFVYDPRESIQQKAEEKIKDGDYVYSIGWQGVYWVSIRFILSHGYKLALFTEWFEC